jgi:predicted TIM-barrel fold metal-dependent hydrolase
MPVIDADAHVVETERSWDFMDPGDAGHRPILVVPPGEPGNLYWEIDAKPRRRATLIRDAGQRRTLPKGKNTAVPEEAREMADLEARIRHMDKLGIDVQVLHNTLFIEAVADRSETELAICKSWNRWLGDIWKRGQGRFRWSCVVPLQSMDEAIAEIRYAKENGAVAVCLRPIEGDRILVDPYFYPIYEEASRQNMAIAVHIANSNSHILDVFRSTANPASGFGSFRAMTAAACHNYISSEVPHVFPDLRWGFIEASAGWIPWVYQEAARRSAASGKSFPADVFKRYRIYVTCQTDDDIPYILRFAGEDNLVIGTDYGHFDPGSEVDAIEVFGRRTDISETAMRKILEDNPAALYGLQTGGGA